MSIANSGPSSGGNLAKLTKRVADLELKLSKFTEQRVVLKTTTGSTKDFVIVAKRQGKSDLGLGPAPFSMVRLRKIDQNFGVTIAPGWVRETLTEGRTPDPKDQTAEATAQDGGAPGPDGIMLHAPAYNGVDLFEDPAPEITMKMGEKLYAYYQTDAYGKVTGKVEIKASLKTKKTRRYQPKDGELGGGLTGAYYVRIGELITKNDVVVWKPGQNSDIEHVHDLPTFKNTGEGSGVFKIRKLEDDHYQVRKVKGRYGMKDEIHPERDDQVELNVDVENVGDGEQLVVTEGEDGKPAKDADVPLKIRTIRALRKEEASASGGDPQIRVVTSEGKKGGKGDSIIVKGNAIRGSLALNDCKGKEVAKIAWEDGLIITAGDAAATLGDCDDDRRGSGSDTPPPP